MNTIRQCGKRPCVANTQPNQNTFATQGRFPQKKSLCILTALLFAIPAHAIDIPEEAPTPEQEFKTLILEVAEKGTVAASDYQEIASQTIALATPAKESGKPLGDSIIHDALAAVEAGRELNPLATDWGQLENELLALLEKPPEQDQQQGDEQNEENQDKEEQEGENGSENSEQQEDESGEQDQQQEGEDGEQQDSSEQGKNGEPQEQNEPQQGGSKMGDLDEEQPEEQEAGASEGEEEAEPEASEQQQQQSAQEDMQSIGGQQQAPQQINGDLAVMLQKLEQLKQQDDPAKLFQILQQAESGEETQQPSTDQDW